MLHEIYGGLRLPVLSLACGSVDGFIILVRLHAPWAEVLVDAERRLCATAVAALRARYELRTSDTVVIPDVEPENREALLDHALMDSQ